MKNKYRVNLQGRFFRAGVFLVAVFLFCFVCSCATIRSVDAQDNSNSNGVNAGVNSNSNQNNNSSSFNADQNSTSQLDSTKTIEQKQQDLSVIEEKIKTYEKLLEVKRGQQATLSNQMDIIDSQIEETKQEIQKYEKDISLLESQIEQIDLDIADKNKLIEAKENALRILINDLYRKDDRGIIEILLSYSGISSFVQEIAYTEQADQKFLGKLQEINALKKDLETKRAEQDQKKRDMETSRAKGLQTTQYLEGEQGSKERMLEETQGEESKYQEMLKRVEAEKQTILGDLDELSASDAGELNIVQSNQEKPTSGLASTDWYYSQRDSRWGGNNIGFSNTKMSKYGCAVTSIAMVLRYHGIGMDPGILAHQPIFSNDLIVWPDMWQYVKRIGGYSHGNIDWKTVDNELADHNPVVVFVRANGRGAGHYVVVHHKDNKGKYVVHDPYWGPNMYLDSTRENIGTLYHSSTSVDQMIIYHNTKRSLGDLPPQEPAPETTKKNTNTNKNANTNASAQGLSANEYDKISGQINNSNKNSNNSNNNSKNSNKNGK